MTPPEPPANHDDHADEIPPWHREGGATNDGMPKPERQPQATAGQRRVPGLIRTAVGCLILPALLGALALVLEVLGGGSRLNDRMVDIIWVVLVVRLSLGLLRHSSWSRWFLVVLVALSVLALPLMMGRVASDTERTLLMLQVLPMAVGAALLLTPAAGRWFAKGSSDR